MTNEEAIKWLRAIEEKYIHGGDEGFDARRKEAINLAIKALEQKLAIQKAAQDMVEDIKSRSGQ